MVAVVRRNDGTVLVEGLDRVVMGLLRLRHLKLLPSENERNGREYEGCKKEKKKERQKERKKEMGGKGRKGNGLYGLYL